MYTSAINPGRSRQALKSSGIYLAVSIGCIIFNKVYALFGHGVSSGSMTFMFLYPLFLGALPFFILWLFVKQADKLRYYRTAYNCWNSGIALLVIESLLNGIFEIAGTSSPYLPAFTVAGRAMLAAGAVIFILNLIRRRTVAENPAVQPPAI